MALEKLTDLYLPAPRFPCHPLAGPLHDRWTPPPPEGWPTWTHNGRPDFSQPYTDPAGTDLTVAVLPAAVPQWYQADQPDPGYPYNQVPMPYAPKTNNGTVTIDLEVPARDYSDPLDKLLVFVDDALGLPDLLYLSAFFGPDNMNRIYQLNVAWFQDISGNPVEPPTERVHYKLVSATDVPPDNGQLLAQIAALQLQVQQLTTQVTELTQQVLTLTMQNNVLIQQLADANATIAQKDQQLASLNSQIASLNSQIASLQTANASLQGQIAGLNSQISTLQATNAALAAQNQQLVSQNAVLQAQLAVLGPQVLSFDLVDTDTHLGIVGYTGLTGDSVTIDYTKLPTRNLCLRANCADGTTAVLWTLDANATAFNDTVAPFTNSATTADPYTPWVPALGSHVLTATPSAGTVKGRPRVLSVLVKDAPQGLNASYFANGTLTGTAVSSKVVSQLNFTWASGAYPSSQITATPWSARWAGQLVPLTSGSYTFYTQSDDGIRLWVNGVLLIDNWTTHGSTENKAGVILTLLANQKYDVKVEYFNSGGAGTAVLKWQLGTGTKEVVPAARLFTA